MTKRQISLLNMFRGLRDFCNANASVFSDKDFFKVPYEEFEDLIPPIEAAAAEQEMNTAPATANKLAKRNALIDIGEKFRAGINMYAINTGDSDIMVNVPKSRNELYKASDDSLLGKASRISLVATPVIASLAPYGLSADDLTALDDAHDAFSAAMALPRNIRKDIKDATEDVGILIDEANNILHTRLDPAATAMKAFDEDFTQNYFINREIDDPAYQTLSLRIHVVDGAVGGPVADALITLEPINIERRTTDLGNAEFRNLPEETLTVRVEQEGYVTATVPAYIVPGQTEEIDVVLQPV